MRDLAAAASVRRSIAKDAPARALVFFSFVQVHRTNTASAFPGPLFAVGLMPLWANDLRAAFWAAVLPGLMDVALLLVGVRGPKRHESELNTNPLTRANPTRLGKACWCVVVIGALFTLGAVVGCPTGRVARTSSRAPRTKLCALRANP
jgi:hypothetical protein